MADLKRNQRRLFLGAVLDRAFPRGSGQVAYRPRDVAKQCEPARTNANQ
jgi:hypothetical protein